MEDKPRIVAYFNENVGENTKRTTYLPNHCQYDGICCVNKDGSVKSIVPHKQLGVRDLVNLIEVPPQEVRELVFLTKKKKLTKKKFNHTKHGIMLIPPQNNKIELTIPLYPDIEKNDLVLDHFLVLPPQQETQINGIMRRLLSQAKLDVTEEPSTKGFFRFRTQTVEIKDSVTHKDLEYPQALKGLIKRYLDKISYKFYKQVHQAIQLEKFIVTWEDSVEYFFIRNTMENSMYMVFNVIRSEFYNYYNKDIEFVTDNNNNLIISVKDIIRNKGKTKCYITGIFLNYDPIEELDRIILNRASTRTTINTGTHLYLWVKSLRKDKSGRGEEKIRLDAEHEYCLIDGYKLIDAELNPVLNSEYLDIFYIDYQEGIVDYFTSDLRGVGKMVLHDYLDVRIGPNEVYTHFYYKVFPSTKMKLYNYSGTKPKPIAGLLNNGKEKTVVLMMKFPIAIETPREYIIDLERDYRLIYVKRIPLDLNTEQWSKEVHGVILPAVYNNKIFVSPKAIYKKRIYVPDTPKSSKDVMKVVDAPHGVKVVDMYNVVQVSESALEYISI